MKREDEHAGLNYLVFGVWILKIFVVVIVVSIIIVIICGILTTLSSLGI